MELKKRETGKILRFKSGYNPNSSSVGSHIPAFLFYAVGTGAMTIIVLNIMNQVDKLIKKGKKTKQG